MQRRVTRVTVDAIVGISCSQLDEREREGEEKRREERGEEEEVYCCFIDTTIHPPGSNCLPLGTPGLQMTRSSYFKLMGG